MLGYNDGVRGSVECSVDQVRVQRGSDRVQRGSDCIVRLLAVK